MTRPGRYPAEIRERAVRMVFEHVGRQYSIQPMISAFRSQRRASRIRRMRFSCPTGVGRG